MAEVRCGQTELTNTLLRHGSHVNNLGGFGLLGDRLVVLHEGEGENLLDRVVVGEEHDHAVNTHTPTTSRWQTVLQSLAESLVDKLGLVVTLLLLAGLLFEAKTLVKGIVQLGVSVDNLLLADESLETLAETLVAAVILGERRHHLGVTSDHSGVDALLLDKLTDKLVEHASVCKRRRALDVGLLEHALEELVGLVGVQLVAFGELFTTGFLESGNHLDALPGLGPVDGVDLAVLGLELGLVATGQVLDEVGHKVLGGVHQVVDIGKSLVELASGELGVVGKIDTLVAELTANLVDTLETTDDQLLEEQLGGDTHVQLHIEVIVVCLEGLGGSTTSDGVHHGSLDLDEVTRVEVVADVGDHLGAGDEGATSVVVHDQVEELAAVALLLVLEAVVLVGELVQAGGEEGDFLGEERELARVAGARVGAARVALDADDVSTAQQLVLLGKGLVAGRLLRLAHDLHAHTLGADIVEAQVGSRRTLVVDAGSNVQSLLLLVLARLEVAELLLKFAQVVVDVELVRVGVGLVVLAELLDGSAADLEVLVGVQVSLLLLGAGSLLLCWWCSGRCRLLGLLGLLFALLLALLDYFLSATLPRLLSHTDRYARSVLLTFSPVTSSR